MKRPGSTGRRYDIVAFGASAGGGGVLKNILSALPKSYELPILVAQHLHVDDDEGFVEYLGKNIALNTVTPIDKEKIKPGHVYVAPADYHMLLERDGSIALSIEAKVNWSRPSIDVLFESLARARGEAAVAILLSGASSDGTEGMRCVKARGGMTLAQDPREAEHSIMPESAVQAGVVTETLGVKGLAKRLLELGEKEK